MSEEARVICCGEALIDMIPTECDGASLAYQPCSGGSVFNTAIALGRLGIPTEFLTGLSSDLFGEQIKQALVESGVGSSLCKQSKLPTTLAFVKLANGHATYHFYDENSAGRMLSIDDVGPVPASINALFFGGISLAVEPCARTYEAIALREAENHVIMVDPNVRPGFIEDANVYRTRIRSMMAHSDIVKLSDEDIAWFFPELDGLEARVGEVQKLGPSIVVITKGADGATAYLCDGREISIRSEQVTVVDTVGAGDTFNAGMLAKLDEMNLLNKSALKSISDEAIAQAMAYAARVAGVTVSRKGANPPWAGEL
ncbi:carbohydrate kinase [uncultured Cohaesibacter sp.]|uniref:carbohydrate kinase family protein n=1 Tax=uncultured Cohaesibacter sp. TaxID=1002546 RepID=UPI0029C6268D|nr:carbohydrate kinase [uncultured Cohaesibacter sp.]